jgi:hypothetical protein
LAVSIPPPYETTGYRRMINSEGVPVEGRLALQWGPGFILFDVTEGTTLPRRTAVALGQGIKIPEGSSITFVTLDGTKILELAQGGGGEPLIGFFGATPVVRPQVEAARTPRDLALEDALALLGLIEVLA